MEFNFSEDQFLLQQTVRDFLTAECTPEWIREAWASETGHSRAFWGQLAELGVPGLLIDEAQGGLGMDEIDGVLLFEEVGRAACPAPLVSAAVGARILQDLGNEALAGEWLPKVAAGEALLAVGHPASPFVADAHIADLILLCEDEAIHAVRRADAELIAEPGNDPGRRLYSVSHSAAPLLSGEAAARVGEAALDRGALACAAGQLGVGQRLIEIAVEYASQRKQFGVPIGSFQAVKHMLADVKVQLEYARSLVYRAAHSVATGAPTRSADASMAKVCASDAATQAAKTALQVHGAIGYTWEQDLHLWMRRAWSLDLAFGDRSWHRARLAEAVIDGTRPVAPFGYSAPNAA